MWITMSISVAPALIQARASKTFTVGNTAPNGKPIVAHTLTSVPTNRLAANGMNIGLTQAEAKWCALASSQSCFTCPTVASGLSKVWSSQPAIALP
jgi:hypothetical protein